MAAGAKARRVAAFTALWRVVRGARHPGAPSLRVRVRAVPRMLAQAVTGRYPHLAYGRLGVMLAALAYLVSPIDLLPEVLLPLIGVGDDALVLAWLAGALLTESERFVVWERWGSAAAPCAPWSSASSPSRSSAEPSFWEPSPAESRSVVGHVVS
jgi:uncharacterized membrane protein YkvA (DUF1232 family)